MDSLPAWLPFLLFPLGLGVLAITMNQQKQTKLLKDEQARNRREKSAHDRSYDSEHTSCPNCAEDVKLAAIVCRYCGADVSASNLKEKQRRNSEFLEWASLEEARAQKLVRSGKLGILIYVVVSGPLLVTLSFFEEVDTFSLFLLLGLVILIGAMVWSSHMTRAKRIRAAIQDIELWEI